MNLSPPAKRLGYALAFSALAHWVFIVLAPIDPPSVDKDTVITAKIAYMPAPPAAKAPAPAAEAPPKAKPKKAKVAPKVVPGTAVVSPPLPDEPKPKEPEKVAEAPVSTPEPPAPVEEPKVAQAEPVKPVEPEPTQAMSSADASAGMFPEPILSNEAQRLAALPRLIDLNYKAAYADGDNYPMPVGQFKMRFEHESGKYELKTMGQASGLFRFLYPGVLRMKSSGRLTEQGIVPEEFSMLREREGRENKPRKVVFDHEAKLIRLNDKPPVPMEGPVFDALTFIVQFYFALPEGDRVTMQVVSPTRLDAYTLTRGGREILDTPQGKIEMEVWRGSRKASEGMAEFWLAPSWHYVPFRVRLTDDKNRKAYFDLDSIAVEASSIAASVTPGVPPK
jgi:hypothetical protein